MLGSNAPQSLALGQLGAIFINDTSVKTGNWGIIYCITACTFTTLTAGLLPDGTTRAMTGTLASIALGAGMVIYGNFTAITLATGSVIAYNT